MPFERILQSVRRWLQHLHHDSKPVYLVIHRSLPHYLQCDLAPDGTIIAHRWTRNPSRATLFSERDKAAVLMCGELPENGRWMLIVELPLYRNKGKDIFP
jgi:hypothetical protein